MRWMVVVVKGSDRSDFEEKDNAMFRHIFIAIIKECVCNQRNGYLIKTISFPPTGYYIRWIRPHNIAFQHDQQRRQSRVIIKIIIICWLYLCTLVVLTSYLTEGLFQLVPILDSNNCEQGQT